MLRRSFAAYTLSAFPVCLSPEALSLSERDAAFRARCRETTRVTSLKERGEIGDLCNALIPLLLCSLDLHSPVHCHWRK